MRGYRSRRFADQRKMLYSVELRRPFESHRWREHYFDTLAMLFFDAGRVASRVSSVLDPGGLHPSGGLGYRMTWNSQLRIRSDFAFSSEGQMFLLSFGNLF